MGTDPANPPTLDGTGRNFTLEMGPNEYGFQLSVANLILINCATGKMLYASSLPTKFLYCQIA